MNGPQAIVSFQLHVSTPSSAELCKLDKEFLSTQHAQRPALVASRRAYFLANRLPVEGLAALAAFSLLLLLRCTVQSVSLIGFGVLSCRRVRCVV